MATIKKVGVIILAVIAIYWVFIVSAFFYMGVINPKAGKNLVDTAKRAAAGWGGVTGGRAVGGGVVASEYQILNATIFVAIPTYRDDECAFTVDELFRQASNPDRIHVGIAQFNQLPDDAHIDCATVCQYCKARADQITIRRFEHTVAAGPATSRAESVKLYNGEEFYMQIDSHSIFRRGWDVLAIQLLNACDSPKPFLTSYPMPYKIVDYGNATLGQPRITTRDGLEDKGGIPYICGGTFNKNDYQIISMGRSLIVQAPPRPLVTTHYAGGYTFSSAAALNEVPFDPNIKFLFGPDETLRAARLWTHGWDLYAPHINIIGHHYTRPDKPKFWAVNPSWYEVTKRSARRALCILGQVDCSTLDEDMKVDLDRYGLGTVRSISDWDKLVGIHWNNATVADHCGKYYDRETERWLQLPMPSD